MSSGTTRQQALGQLGSSLANVKKALLQAQSSQGKSKVPKYGQNVTDSMGRVGKAAFNPNTGEPLDQDVDKPMSQEPGQEDAMLAPEAGALDPRAQALASLKEQGYASPDEAEIQGAMNDVPLAGSPNAGSQDLKQKYDTSFQAGAPAGTNLDKQGPAMAGIQSVQPPQRDTTPIDNFYDEAENPVIKGMLDQFAEMMSPPKQSETLMAQYQKLVKNSGLNEINAELINTKKIIEGTEDDIRAEVTAADGFATNSQVLAMASARNKSLIQNYNSLLSTRDSIQEQISTSVSLMKEDKQIAEQRLSQQMNFGFKILEYRDKMQNNAKEAYNNVVKNVGYQGLYNSLAHDPYTLSLAERSLGLASGGLQSLASMPDPEAEKDALQLDVLRSNLLTDQFQRANIQSQIDERGRKSTEKQENEHGTLNAKPQTIAQATANGYADRLSQANKIVANIGDQFASPLAIGGFLPNVLKSSERQQFDQATDNFINAVLRRESGATILPSERSDARKQYFPQPGDAADTLLQKSDNRNTAINNFYREANVPRPVYPGDIIQGEDGNKYRVGPDGETLEQI